jgi:DNA-binding MarR family transcriptional regulator
MKSESSNGSIEPPPAAGGLRNATTSYLLAMVHHAIRARLEAALKPANITALQFTILEVIAAHGGITSADLSRRFYVTPQTMGETIALLVRRGLARREASDDRRVLAIHVTDEGRALLSEGEAALARIEDEVFGAVNAAELGALHGVLVALVRSLRSAPADSAAA